MVLIYSFEIGMIQLLWTFSVPMLSLGLYALILTGFGIQYFLLRKVQKPIRRWSFAIFLALAVLGCEWGFHAAPGFDKLGPIFIFSGVFCLALGAILAGIIGFVKNYRNGS